MGRQSLQRGGAWRASDGVGRSRAMAKRRMFEATRRQPSPDQVAELRRLLEAIPDFAPPACYALGVGDVPWQLIRALEILKFEAGLRHEDAPVNAVPTYGGGWLIDGR